MIITIKNQLRNHRDKIRDMLAITIMTLICILSIAGCSSGNNNNGDENFCYLESSLNPCFDPNQDGTTAFVTDQTVMDVIEEQEAMEGFEEQLPLTNIFNAYKLGNFPPLCPFEESELVIKTNNDWDRFRNSCFFSTHDLPELDFADEMVLVSIQEFGQLETMIVAVLEFHDHQTAIIEDINFPPPPSPGNSINIISLSRTDKPVDFIRIENDFSPF